MTDLFCAGVTDILGVGGCGGPLLCGCGEVGCGGCGHVRERAVVNDGADGRKIAGMTTLTDPGASQAAGALGGAESVDRSLYPIFDDLASVLEGYLAPEERVQVERAYEFAQIAHSGHTRRSGHPYISHPLAAAIVCAELQLDVPALQAALLHDVMEDCGITRSELVDAFGVDVAKLVDGATKLSALRLPDVDHPAVDEDAQAENLRKMFIAMADDVRVVIVKLADRLHNMRTLWALPEEKQRRISRETMEIYAPLAARLGIWQIRAQLEDLSFKYLEPVAYAQVSKQVAARRSTRERYLRQLRRQLENALEAVGLRAEVKGRVKHLYSIHQKMRKYAESGKSFSDIYDLLALRVLTESTADCYAALGIVHGMWRPLPGEFDDYIASPRPSGYQSLHTTAFWSPTHPVEVQIRTRQMDYDAEYGVAVHWLYKEGRGTDPDDRERLSWLRQLVDWQGELPGSGDFLETLRSDIFQDQVFVHTPAGEIIALRRGATPLDFAFRIHTDIGYSCVGAKVNGRLVQLTTPLDNGDVVEIVTSRTARGPSRDWLNPALGYVTTQHARTKIRQWFRRRQRDENIARGREELERELRRLSLRLSRVEDEVVAVAGAKTLDDALALIGAGEPSAHQVALRVATPDDEPLPARAPAPDAQQPDNLAEAVRVLGAPNVLTRIAACCAPRRGDPIRGYVTRSRGVSVHRTDCHYILHLAEQNRLLDVQWSRGGGSYVARLRVDGWDRVGFARDVTTVCADEDVNMVALTTSEPSGGQVSIGFSVEAVNLAQVQRLIHKLDQIRGVTTVERDN